MNEVQPIRDKAIVDGIINYLRLINERDYIFVSLGFHSGLRVSDLLKLKVKDVRDQTHINYVAEKTKNRVKKKKKKKMFIIHPDIIDDLNLYIQGRDDNEYLFASRQRKTLTGAKGEPFHRSTAYKMLRKVGKRFGLEQMACHTLRKTWGYHLFLAHPKNIALLMRMYGHEDQATTLDYLGLTQDEMDQAISESSYT